MSQGAFTELYPSVWTGLRDRGAIMSFAEAFKDFAAVCKTERETAAETIKRARERGFRDLDGLCAAGARLKAGDKVYLSCHGKAVLFFVMGQRPLADGIRLICAHADAPRLDVRPNPLYERDGLALLKTHYYGGVKKYQWAALPLALHGVVVKRGGERVQVVIGEDETDPVFYISDLPIHLAAEQMEKKLAEGLTGEELNLIAGSIPEGVEDGTSVKTAILKLLNDRYGIGEKDLAAAELEIVPAGKPRDAGLDASMIVS